MRRRPCRWCTQRGWERSLEQFFFEIALLARRRQSPRSGVDSGENHVFRQNDALKQGVFQKQNALSCLRLRLTKGADA